MEEEIKEIKFDSILPREIPVTLGDKVYKLRAPSAAVTNKFRASMSDCYRVEDGKAVVSKPARAVEIHTSLVSQCFYDPDGKPVPASVIMDMPNEIVEALIRGSIDLCRFSKAEGDDDIKK